MLAFAAGSSLLGAQQAREKQKQQARMNMAEAVKTEFSPWTGVQGNINLDAPSTTVGALQGGLTGAMMGQQFANMNSVKPKPDDMTNVYGN
jgi:hypothetical protein